MKFLVIIALIVIQTINCNGQDFSSATSLTIRHISLSYIHFIPKLFIMKDINEFRNSSADSICLLTDVNSFDKLIKFIYDNRTNKKIDSSKEYEYGSFEIVLKMKNDQILKYVLDNNSGSINYFHELKEFIRLNNIDDNASKKVSLIIPNSTESGLR